MGTTANICIGGATLQIANDAGTLEDVGYIKDGVTIAPAFEGFKVENIEGMTGIAAMRRTKTEYTVRSTLVEPTLENIRKAWSITAAEGGSNPATLKIDAVAQPIERKIQITGIAPGGTGTYVRTILMRRCVVESPGELKFTDFEETKLPVTFVCLYDSTNTEVGNFSDVTA